MANVHANGKPADPLTINGARFLHIATSDAGMCHQVSREIYGAFRGGSCFLFEAATQTFCPGVVDGTRELMPAETRALARHLDSIVQSITIGPPK
jgi:hypothetical protein